MVRERGREVLTCWNFHKAEEKDTPRPQRTGKQTEKEIKEVMADGEGGSGGQDEVGGEGGGRDGRKRCGREEAVKVWTL